MVTYSEVITWTIENYDIVSIFIIILFFAILSIRYFRNKEEQEQKSWVGLVFVVVIFGVLSVILAIIFSILMLYFVPEQYGAVIVAPIAEEIAKGMVVGLIAKTRLIQDKMDGVVYGAMVGTGFAAAENFLYAFTLLNESGFLAGLFLASFRSVFILIGHPLYTGLTGIGIGAYKEGKTETKYITIWQGILLHTLWNSVMVFDLGQNFIVAFIGVIILSIIIMRIQISRAKNK